MRLTVDPGSAPVKGICAYLKAERRRHVRFRGNRTGRAAVVFSSLPDQARTDTWGPQTRGPKCPFALNRRGLDAVGSARAGAVGDDRGHAGEAVAGFGDVVDLLAAGVPAGDHEGAGD